ncbi:Fe(3+) ABC transporter substrate-binding protein [Bauldia litoralis]|uniref:Iron(III) transport system substrate-binding protein n=1 Tax=Bauldia litoralis TaxID=665467 RepID=A0A1G6ECT8_9HYPH|nr:Fe(3+) ABC transporter substrate-binding protein [Bauldia litoralis]SDB55216.1 iron(III) transport system substrate-binding protein [Bauldia litoralis]
MLPTVPLRRLAVFVSLALLPAAALADGEVNLYTTREPGLVKPLLDAFTEDTGIAVNTVFVDAGLPERVSAEGENSPADVLMTVDFGNLADLVDAGVTQPVASDVLDAVVPENLRDPEGRWYALSMRARVLYASKDRTDLDAFTYEELADPAWNGKVCIRSGQHPYNNALIAAYIAHHGEEATRTWLEGVKANLARQPGGGDRDVARDILGEICDIGIGNSYYVGLMRSGAGGPDQEEWGKAIDIVLPTFADGGTHVNVSGAALAAHAPNRDNAIRLLEFLVSEEAQAIYAKANFEYPVREGAEVDPIIDALGPLTPDTTLLTEIASHRKAASELVDAVGFND